MSNKANETVQQKPQIPDMLVGKTYLDPTYDPAFFALLGDEEALKDFLNSILHLDEDNSIRTLEFVCNQPLVFRTPESKEIKFDIHAWTRNDRCLDIEIQRASHSFFHDRVIMYNAYLAIRGKVKMDNSPEFLALDEKQQKVRRYEMPEAISIWICNFPLHLTGGYKDSWHLYSDNDVAAGNAVPISTKMNYIFVDLKEFAKTNPKVQNKEDQWIYLLANAGNAKDLSVINDPIIQKALGRILVDSASEELLSKQVTSMIAQDEIDCRLAEGYLSGVEKGLEEGRAEGADSKNRELAKAFRDAGVPIEIISKQTALSPEQIKAL